MSSVLVAILFGLEILFIGLCAPYIEAIKTEDPVLYLELGEPRVAKYMWLHRFPIAFSKLTSSRSYRAVLANSPRAKAWGSWVLAVYWLRALAFVALLFSIVD